MSLAVNDPKLPSEQVADQIRQKINASGYPDGRLPSTRQLAADFGIATQTVRNGLRILVDEGLVFSAGNRGYFITNAVPAGSAAPGPTRGLREEIKEIHSAIQELAARVAALEEISRSGSA
ncbi:GntR family transcriptional regulator [Streptacidiphilus rugosus]|uniref:GntR family transcriptional regulator n=1 Tax=Streptacidiphilus rugosus TaxID=405783 RepID=UPI0007C6D44F|nr:GntR family transcriptional regulator [Streptacidiphilus rugosus]